MEKPAIPKKMELKRVFYRRGRSGSFTCREGNLHATGSTSRSRNTGRPGKQAEPQDRRMGYRRKTHAENEKKHIRALRLQWIGSIAASLLILLSVGLYLYKPYPAPQDTCATPEEAYAQAQKALIMLSSSLNKGIEKVESVQEATGKIQENVNEQLNRLNNIKQ